MSDHYKKYQKAPLKFDDMDFEGHFYAGFVWPQISSRTGEKYDVELTEKGFKCTCIGFNRHGKCKHIEAVHTQLTVDPLDVDSPDYL